jgi:hypothetical protein
MCRLREYAQAESFVIDEADAAWVNSDPMAREV